ncbi:MAG: ferredoxin family protein [Candidatus Brocadiia bacterium]
MSDKEFDVKVLREYCKGCGLCVEVCPEGKLEIDPNPNDQGRQSAVVLEEVHCTGCSRCATICPDAAIEIYRLVTTTKEESSGQ